jgi:nitrite reductase (NADH) small subunit
MTDTRWIRITPTENVPEREGRALQLGTESVALFNLGGRFVAVENRCPHGGGPIADGIVGGSTVTCPMHNWRICLDSGSVTKPCAAETPALRTYPVKVEDGVILLGLAVEKATAAA